LDWAGAAFCSCGAGLFIQSRWGDKKFLEIQKRQRREIFFCWNIGEIDAKIFFNAPKVLNI
jgi:hypothetical protein